MKLSEYEISNINRWIRINRDVIKNIYSVFLDICNDKYNLNIINSKQLFFDLSLYLYYNAEDKYGMTFFDNSEEKKKYMNSFKEDYKNDENNITDSYDINNSYDTPNIINSYIRYNDINNDTINNNSNDVTNNSNKEINKNNRYKEINDNVSLSDYSTFTDNYSENFDDFYTDEYWDELYNNFFNNDDPSLYHYSES